MKNSDINKGRCKKLLKVMTIVGTRPEIIKLSRVINELDKHTNHILVNSQQNYDYELNEIFFKGMNIRKPDYFLKNLTLYYYMEIQIVVFQ